jgi:hypothetical protein
MTSENTHPPPNKELQERDARKRCKKEMQERDARKRCKEEMQERKRRKSRERGERKEERAHLTNFCARMGFSFRASPTKNTHTHSIDFVKK